MKNKPTPQAENSCSDVAKSLMAAALLLPLVGTPAHAESAPEKSTIAYKYLDYLDSQPDAERISVKAHGLLLTAPLSESWSFSGTLVRDAVSGASPRYHTSRLTGMEDLRKGYSLGVTNYSSTGTATATATYSTESDYISRSISGTLMRYTDDSKNTALTFGVGLARDAINPSNLIVTDEKKRVNDLMLGVTQVLTPVDIAQVNVRHSRGTGYFSDPYKAFDERPRERNISTVLTRWNHHFKSVDGTLRTSYRYYTDSYKIKAHTLGFEYAQVGPDGWTVTPQLRWHSQGAAWFYVPANPGRNGVTFPDPEAVYYTEDQRMSSFGAVTLGMKVSRQISSAWLMDVKYEHYKQKASWSTIGQGDDRLADFKTRSVQVGLSYQF